MTVRIKYTHCGNSEILEFKNLAEAVKQLCDGAFIETSEDYLSIFDEEDQVTPQGQYHWSFAERDGWAESEEDCYAAVLGTLNGDNGETAEIVGQDELSPSEAAALCAEALAAAGFTVFAKNSKKSSSVYLEIRGKNTTIETGFRTHSHLSQGALDYLVLCPISKNDIAVEIEAIKSKAGGF